MKWGDFRFGDEFRLAFWPGSGIVPGNGATFYAGVLKLRMVEEPEEEFT